MDHNLLCFKSVTTFSLMPRVIHESACGGRYWLSKCDKCIFEIGYGNKLEYRPPDSRLISQSVLATYPSFFKSSLSREKHKRKFKKMIHSPANIIPAAWKYILRKSEKNRDCSVGTGDSHVSLHCKGGEQACVCGWNNSDDYIT